MAAMPIRNPVLILHRTTPVSGCNAYTPPAALEEHTYKVPSESIAGAVTAMPLPGAAKVILVHFAEPASVNARTTPDVIARYTASPTALITGDPYVVAASVVFQVVDTWLAVGLVA
jgi:hypothetical protein